MLLTIADHPILRSPAAFLHRPFKTAQPVKRHKRPRLRGTLNGAGKSFEISFVANGALKSGTPF